MFFVALGKAISPGVDGTRRVEIINDRRALSRTKASGDEVREATVSLYTHYM